MTQSIAYNAIPFVYKPSQLELTHQQVQGFLEYILKSHSLTISDYFDQMNSGSFFLLAATGLGKTVGVPVYILSKLLKQHSATHQDDTAVPTLPRVWVVVPKIPIAISEAVHLNELFKAYDKRIKGKLFGYRTSQGTKFAYAPIQFITTGVLPLIAMSGELKKGIDVVIIDEAHVTLEAGEQVELAVARLLSDDITVHYMSATVATDELEIRLLTNVIIADKSRFVNFYHNTAKPLADSINEIISETLVRYNTSGLYFPKPDFAHQQSVLEGTNPVVPTKRASGLLVVVNSFAGKNSDADSIEEKISSLCKQNGITILKFAGKVERNKQLKAEFVTQYQQLEKSASKYVIISTSIVEMGITWSTLDYVVTMDSEYDTVLINGFSVPQLVPLGTNALKQRGGRVGRKRAGCVYITKEFGTDYTDLSDNELNTQGLTNQAIRFPLTKSDPTVLAYQLATSGTTGMQEIFDHLHTYGYPSILTKREAGEALYKIERLMAYYKSLGVTKLTTMSESTSIHDYPLSEQAIILASRWVGRPCYPFVLQGMRWLVGSNVLPSKYLNKTKRPGEFYSRPHCRYDVFFYYMYLAALVEFPVSMFFNTDPATNARYNAVDWTATAQEGGKRLIAYQASDMPTCSDLITMGYNIEDVAAYAFGLDGRGVVEGSYVDNTYSLSSKRAKAIGLKLPTIRKFDVSFLDFCKEIKKTLVKHQFVGERFWDYVSGIDLDNEGSEFDNMSAISCIINSPEEMPMGIHVDDASTRFRDIIYPEMVNIYHATGSKLKLGRTQVLGIYEYTTKFQGVTLSGAIDQRDHYCQLNTDHTFWCFMAPYVDRKTNKTLLKPTQLFREELRYGFPK